MTLDLSRRILCPVLLILCPALLSVGIHGAVIAGLLYTSGYQVIGVPVPAASVSIIMVAAAGTESRRTIPPPAEPIAEPEPAVSLPEDTPVVIHKPRPKPKPRPKAVKKVQEQVKREVRSDEARLTSALTNSAPSPGVAGGGPVNSKPASIPRALRLQLPRYPARARALRIEGRVRVQYDVASDGRVNNVKILFAQPENLFEREVKAAVRRWRFEPGEPGYGLTRAIVFRLNGAMQID